MWGLKPFDPEKAPADITDIGYKDGVYTTVIVDGPEKDTLLGLEDLAKGKGKNPFSQLYDSVLDAIKERNPEKIEANTLEELLEKSPLAKKLVQYKYPIR